MKRHANCSVVSVAHRLPCEHEETLVRNREADILGAPRTILLVEDNTFVRQAMASALCSSGYIVLIAADGAQAFETCRNCAQPIDLLLSDMVMPNMSGGELAEKFRAMFPSANVLLMSGYSEELTPHASSPQCRLFLRKPFSIDTLIRAVGDVLETHSLSQVAVDSDQLLPLIRAGLLM
jgi:CheY-like chemotaxis protein